MSDRAASVNERIRAGKVVVRTLEQVCRSASEGGELQDTVVVSAAFVTGIAGTAAMLCVPVAERGVFTRAAAITLNGVRAHPGPAPNERLGVVDALVFADECAQSVNRPYDGAALFIDLLRGNSIQVECRAVEGTTHRNALRLEALDFARLYVYNAVVPAGPAIPTGLLDALHPGARIVLNGSHGIVVGTGTRHRAGAPAFSLAADLHGMDPELMSGSDGGRPQHTLALAVPVRNGASIAGMVGWANSSARDALLCPTALDAAARLQRLVQEGRFLLTEAGVPDTEA